MGNPNPSPETRFKKGQSGNPGGMPKETAELIRENAERASKLRAQLLAQLEKTVSGGGSIDLDSETLRLLKDSEDRGYGAPKQESSVENSGSITFKTVYEGKGD